MTKKIYKTISKEEYEQLQNSKWERLTENELFYRTTAIRRFWRPAMAWLYFVVIALDFILFPILSIQAGLKEYEPITLHGGGLFHVAMGAIVASASIGRSWEKMSQYRMDHWGNNMGGDFDSFGHDPYLNSRMPYPGSPPVNPNMVPKDNIGDALSNNEDEILPPRPER